MAAGLDARIIRQRDWREIGAEMCATPKGSEIGELHTCFTHHFVVE